jgi:hypothetical protein
MRRVSRTVAYLMTLLMLVTVFSVSPVPFARSTAYAQAISLGASSASWVPVLVGAKFDPGQDTQATSAIDLQGNTQNPLMYLWYDDKGDTDTANDELALRFRVDKARDSQSRFSGYLWIGMDVDMDGDLDVFLMLEGKTGAYQLNVFNAGTGLNNSPSTSSIDIPVLLADLTQGTTFRIDNVTAIDGVSVNGNVDGDSEIDDFVSLKFNFSQFAALANAKPLTGGGDVNVGTINSGAGLTKNTPLRFVVASAQQTNALNGDMGGYNKTDNQTTTFTDQGAFTTPLSLGDPAGTNTATAITLTGPSSVAAGAASGNFTLTVVNQDGTPTPVAQNTTFSLSSNSAGTVTFMPASPVTVLNGASSATFAYSDTLASPTPKEVTATWASGGTTLGSVTHGITVTAGLAAAIFFTTPARTITAGSTSDVITVELRDSYRNVATSNGGTTIDLSAPGITFRNAADDANITQVTIADGLSSADFRATAATGGSYTLTAANLGLDSVQQPLSVIAALTLNGSAGTVYVGGTQQFTAAGGVAPYTFTIPTNNSVGATVSGTGLYTAGLTGGVTDTVQVADGHAATATATVSVVKRPTRTVVTCSPGAVGMESLTTCTATVTDTSNEANLVHVAGSVAFGTDQTGAGSFTAGSSCTLDSGACSVTYKPTGNPGTHVISAEFSGSDAHLGSVSSGNDRQSLQVSAGIIISPASATVPVNGTQTFAASGGVGPYTYSVVGGASAANGSVGTSSGEYTGGSQAGLAVYVRATDTLGASADAAVTLAERTAAASVDCAPASVEPGTPVTCTATIADTSNGMAQPLSAANVSFASDKTGDFGLVTCTGTTTLTCTVTYTPTGDAGAHTVTVNYSGDTGHQPASESDSVAVSATALMLSGSAGTVYVGGTKQFTAAGGVAPYTFTIPTNSSVGATVSATGLYTAGLTGGVTDTVQVADGHAATATAAVSVVRRPTRTVVACSPGAVGVESLTTCTATVTDTSNEANLVPVAGSVAFGTDQTGAGSFTAGSSCTLDSGACSVTYKPTGNPGTHVISAEFSGSDAHLGSDGTGADLTVESGSLGGLVKTDYGTVVAGINLVLVNEAGDTVTQQATGADGAYQFTGLAGGTYTVIVGTVATPLTEASATVPEIGSAALSIVIPATARLTLAATPAQLVGDGRSTSQLQSELRLLDGTPVSGVAVAFAATAGTLADMDLATRADGTALATLKAPLIDGLDDVIKEASVTVHDVDRGLFALAKIAVTFIPSSVEGYVMDNGTPRMPIENASVTVRKVFEDGAVFEAETFSDQQGHYSVRVPKGNVTYDVVIDVPVTTHGVTTTVKSTQVVAVGDVSGTGDVIAATRTINGRLLAPTPDQGGWTQLDNVLPGLPLVGVLRGAAGQVLPNPVVLQPDGSFQVDNVPQGTYEVVFQVQAPDGRRVIGPKLQIQINDGELVVGIALVDPFGIVTDATTNLPIAGVHMELKWADTGGLVDLPALATFEPNGNANSQQTTADGEYAWMVFPDKSYYIVATKQGYSPYDSRDPQNWAPKRTVGDSYVEQGIFHVGETIIDHNFSMRKIPVAPPAPAPAPAPAPVLVPQPTTATVRGVVVDAGPGRPVAGARVTIAGLNVEAYTAADGTYQITVPERNRTYTAQISAAVQLLGKTRQITATQTAAVPPSLATTLTASASRKVAGQLFYAAPGGGEPTTLTAQQAQTIRATLERADGTAVSRPVSVSASGYYEAEDLTAGTYRVLFRTPGADGRLLAVTTVTVPLTQDGQLVLLATLINPYGTVRDAKTGAPLKDVLVSLSWADTSRNRLEGRTPGMLVSLPAAPAFLPENSTNPQHSNDLGHYGWLCLPEGDYYLIAKKDGYLPYDGILHVETASCGIDLTLEPIKIEVLDQYHRYIMGYPDGTFRPENPITRAEVATIFSRLLRPNLDGVTPAKFPDLPTTHWAARHIAVVIEKGLMKGDPQGTFRPDSPITRAELATVVARFKGLPTSSRSLFRDTAGDWAEPYITATFEAGIVLGFTDNTFGPTKTTTRAELVAMVNRMLGWGQLMTGRTEPRWPDVPFTHWAVRHIEKASISHSAKMGTNQLDYMVDEIKETIE